MRILVTGAGGFVGANLVRALIERGDEVHACVRATSDNWRLADITNDTHMHTVDMGDESSISLAVAKSKPEIVYHLAHYGGNSGQSDAALIQRIIVDGTKILYAACMKEGVKTIVNAGSSSEYGPCEEAMREDMAPAPDTDYGVAKLAATRYGEQLSREKGIHITTLRPFSVYGPYEARNRFFPAVILSLMNDVPPTLSNPDTVRDFVHVDDVVAAFLIAPEKPAGIYNVGTGVQTRLEDAAYEIQTALGTKVNLSWGAPGRHEMQSWRADTAHAQRVLGWKAAISLPEGVQKTVAWFTRNKHLYE